MSCAPSAWQIEWIGNRKEPMKEFTSVEEATGQYGLMIMIYGRSGSGKTSCIRNLNLKRWRMLTLEVDRLAALKGVVGIGELTTIEFDRIYSPDTVEEWMSVLTSCVTADIDGVIIDTLSALYEMIWRRYLKDKGLKPDETTYAIYNHCMHVTENIIYRCGDIVAQGKHVIVLCHLKRKEEKDLNVCHTWVEPDLPGQLPEHLCRKFSYILQSKCVERNGKPEYLLVCPRGRSYGKDLYEAVTDPIPNDVALLIPSGGGDSTLQTNPLIGENSSPLTTTMEAQPTTPPPSSPKIKLKITKDPKPEVAPSDQTEEKKERRIRRPKKQLLEELRVKAGWNQEQFDRVIKESFGKNSIDDIVTSEFEALQKELLEFIADLPF